MPYPSERHQLWGSKAAHVAYRAFGLLMGEQAFRDRSAQTIPMPDGRMTDALAEVFAAFDATEHKEKTMERVNLELTIVAVLRDAKSGKPLSVEESPFFVNLHTGYNGLEYAEGLTVQKSLSTAIREHEDRMYELGFAKVKELAKANR